jgi:hypothetical protein
MNSEGRYKKLTGWGERQIIYAATLLGIIGGCVALILLG